LGATLGQQDLLVEPAPSHERSNLEELKLFKKILIAAATNAPRRREAV
jgi:hypothetical protein